LKECNQCGKCCVKYGGDGLSVSDTEIALWETFRPDLHKFVRNGEIWINPDTDEQMKQCPWLRKVPHQDKYTCDIYLDRPDDCKFYPVTIDQMLADECEMLEVQDLKNPTQAQDKLNKIMANSRPPYELESNKGST
jgi:Fe-S-cluster containining protein